MWVSLAAYLRWVKPALEAGQPYQKIVKKIHFWKNSTEYSRMSRNGMVQWKLADFSSNFPKIVQFCGILWHIPNLWFFAESQKMGGLTHDIIVIRFKIRGSPSLLDQNKADVIHEDHLRDYAKAGAEFDGSS